MHIMLKVVLWCLVIYLGYCLLLFLVQRHMLFPRYMMPPLAVNERPKIDSLEIIWIHFGIWNLENSKFQFNFQIEKKKKKENLKIPASQWWGPKNPQNVQNVHPWKEAPRILHRSREWAMAVPSWSRPSRLALVFAPAAALPR